MKVNGKDLVLFYSVGAKCDIDQALIDGGATSVKQYIAKHGDTAMTIKMAAALSKGYCDAFGGEPVTEQDLMSLSMKDYAELDSKVVLAITEGQVVTVEAEPEKKGESTK